MIKIENRLFLLAFLAFIQCVGVDEIDKPGPTKVDPVVNDPYIKITPFSATVVFDETKQDQATEQFKILHYDSDKMKTEPQASSWSVEPDTIGVIDKNGLFTPDMRGAGVTGEIIATYNDLRDTASITINEATAPVSPLSRITISGSTSVLVGESIQLTANGFDGDNEELTGLSFTWLSSDTSIATVDSSGMVTGNMSGSASIQARVEGVESDNYMIMVNTNSPVNDPYIQITPFSATVVFDETKQDQATEQFKILHYDSSKVETEPKASSWSVKPNTIGTIDENGLFTPAMQGVGMTGEIIATYNGLRDTASITINEATAPVSLLSRITISGPTSVLVGESIQLTANGFDGDNEELTGLSFTWLSSDESIATVDNSGMVTGNMLGSVFIQASAEGVESDDYMIMVNVVNDPYIQITPFSATVVFDETKQDQETEQFKILHYDSDRMKTEPKASSWSVQPNTIGAIDENGLFTPAMQGVGIPGEVIATFNGLRDTASITINRAIPVSPLSSITISGPTSVLVGESIQLTANGFDEDDKELTGLSFTWLSSPESIATVDNSGMVTGNMSGSASIQARVEGVESDNYMIMVNTNSSARMGTFQGRGSYSVSGTVTLTEENGTLTVSFGSNFSSQSGPELYIYLSNSPSNIAGAIELGPLKSNSGTQSYDAGNTSITDFNYVLVYCRPFNAPFGSAELN